MMEETINTHNLVIGFGKHKGERWTRLPLSYLRWLANETQGDSKQLALSELERRGTTIPQTLEVSGHAIDRASQITKDWQDVGVHSWLLRLGEEALAENYGKEEVFHKGYKWVFTYGDYYPVLKTIMRKKS